MTTADEARYRGILFFQSLNSFLLLLCVLVLAAMGPRLFESATILRQERQAWQEYRGGEIQRERQHQRTLEALRQSRVTEASEPTAPPIAPP